MDPLSIVANSIAIIQLITAASTTISSFIRAVRESRPDLDEIDRELLSIRRTLELLREDLAPQNETETSSTIPESLERQILGILSCCKQNIKQIEESLKKYQGLVTKSIRGQFHWAMHGKSEMKHLNTSLEANRRALGIAVDVLTLKFTRDIKRDTSVLVEDSSVIKHNTERILVGLEDLRKQLPVEAERAFVLRSYLENLTTYTESVYAEADMEPVDGIEISADEIHQIYSQNEAIALPFRQRSNSQSSLGSTNVILQAIGLPINGYPLAQSFILAVENRLTEQKFQQVQSRTRNSFAEAAPIFDIGSFMFPTLLRALGLSSTLQGFGDRMTPAILRGYRRHPVIDASWPALLPSDDPSHEIVGMVLFDIDDEERAIMNRFQGGLYDFNRARVEIKLQDGSQVNVETLIHVWNGSSSDLRPDAWSPSTFLDSDWFGKIVKNVRAEEVYTSYEEFSQVQK